MPARHGGIGIIQVGDFHGCKLNVGLRTLWTEQRLAASKLKGEFVNLRVDDDWRWGHAGLGRYMFEPTDVDEFHVPQRSVVYLTASSTIGFSNLQRTFDASDVVVIIYIAGRAHVLQELVTKAIVRRKPVAIVSDFTRNPALSSEIERLFAQDPGLLVGTLSMPPDLPERDLTRDSTPHAIAALSLFDRLVALLPFDIHASVTGKPAAGSASAAVFGQPPTVLHSRRNECNELDNPHEMPLVRIRVIGTLRKTKQLIGVVEAGWVVPGLPLTDGGVVTKGPQTQWPSCVVTTVAEWSDREFWIGGPVAGAEVGGSIATRKATTHCAPPHSWRPTPSDIAAMAAAPTGGGDAKPRVPIACYGVGSRIVFRVSHSTIGRDNFYCGLLLGNALGPQSPLNQIFVALVRSISTTPVVCDVGAPVVSTVSHACSVKGQSVAAVTPPLPLEVVDDAYSPSGGNRSEVTSGRKSLYLVAFTGGSALPHIPGGFEKPPRLAINSVVVEVLDSWATFDAHAHAGALLSEGKHPVAATFLNQFLSLALPIQIVAQHAWAAHERIFKELYGANQWDLQSQMQADLGSFGYDLKTPSLLDFLAKNRPQLGPEPLALALTRITQSQIISPPTAGGIFCPSKRKSLDMSTFLHTFLKVPPKELPDCIIRVCGDALIRYCVANRGRGLFLEIMRRSSTYTRISDATLVEMMQNTKTFFGNTPSARPVFTRFMWYIKPGDFPTRPEWALNKSVSVFGESIAKLIKSWMLWDRNLAKHNVHVAAIWALTLREVSRRYHLPQHVMDLVFAFTFSP